MKLTHVTHTANQVISGQCPKCGGNVTFVSAEGRQDLLDPARSTVCGVRVCPNPGCRAMVLVEYKPGTDAGVFGAFRPA